MPYLRIFATPAWLTEWTSKKPRLSQLLSCFEQQVGAKDNPASVFYVRNYREELQTVAAFVQMSPATVDKRFAVYVTKEDCTEAGVKIIPSLGNTGVACVDKRHSD